MTSSTGAPGAAVHRCIPAFAEENNQRDVQYDVSRLFSKSASCQRRVFALFEPSSEQVPSLTCMCWRGCHRVPEAVFEWESSPPSPRESKPVRRCNRGQYIGLRCSVNSAILAQSKLGLLRIMNRHGSNEHHGFGTASLFSVTLFPNSRLNCGIARTP